MAAAGNKDVYLALDISGKGITAVLINRLGEPGIEMSEVFTKPDMTQNDVGDMLKRIVARMLTIDQSPDAQQPSAIGISTKGVVEDGVIRISSKPDLSDFDVKGMLEKEFKLPVFVANNVHAAALGAYWRFYGAEQRAGTNVLLWLSSGVGEGVMRDGRLDEGYNSILGAVGSTLVKRAVHTPGGDRVEDVKLADVLGESGMIARMEKETGKRMTAEQIFELGYDEGDTSQVARVAQRIVVDAEEAAGTLVKDIQMQLDPKEIVVIGYVGRMDEALQKHFLRKIEDDANRKLGPYKAIIGGVKLRAPQLSENDAKLLGAARLAMLGSTVPVAELKDVHRTGSSAAKLTAG